MPINFTDLPSIGDTVEYGGKTFRFGGVYWSAVHLVDQGIILKNTFQAPVVASDYREVLVTVAANPVSNTKGTELAYI